MTKKAFAAGYPQTAYLGSTALVAIVHDNTLYLANAGHSKAVLLRQKEDGQMSRIDVSKTHHINQPDERKKFDAKFGKVKDSVKEGKIMGKVASTRSLGNLWLKKKEYASHSFDTD